MFENNLILNNTNLQEINSQEQDSENYTLIEINARKYAIYLAREILDLSYPNLAKEFNKNHTTIMYQHEKLKKDIETNKAMQIITQELSELIKR